MFRIRSASVMVLSKYLSLIHLSVFRLVLCSHYLFASLYPCCRSPSLPKPVHFFHPNFTIVHLTYHFYVVPYGYTVFIPPNTCHALERLAVTLFSIYCFYSSPPTLPFPFLCLSDSPIAPCSSYASILTHPFVSYFPLYNFTAPSSRFSRHSFQYPTQHHLSSSSLEIPPLATVLSQPPAVSTTSIRFQQHPYSLLNATPLVTPIIKHNHIPSSHPSESTHALSPCTPSHNFKSPHSRRPSNSA